MPDEKYTRCPGCRTIFRVTEEQLALRDGRVRCGHCKNVFDGNAERISLAPPPPAAGRHPAARGAVAPAATRRDAVAGESSSDAAQDALPTPVPPPATDFAPTPQGDGAGRGAQARGGDDPGASPGMHPSVADDLDLAAEPQPEVDYVDRFTRSRRGRWSRLVEKLTVLGLPVLLLALTGQAVFHFRDALAARVPALKPMLVQACALVGCTIGPLHQSSGLSIDASDLQADPAHRGLLMLTATLRNRSGLPLAFPHLELTLTDAQDQVVVRRVLLPPEYVGNGADLAAGIPANAEVPVKVFIDASATNQAGYRLYAFYP
jgi:predicted Zn finger-like uncharacterized protein